MTTDVKLINIKDEILAENKDLADEIRLRLRARGVFLVNLMSSPGSRRARRCSAISASSGVKRCRRTLNSTPGSVAENPTGI